MADRPRPRRTPPVNQFTTDHTEDMHDPNYRLAYLERVNELYREQIAYLISELHRIGWTHSPTEPNE